MINYIIPTTVVDSFLDDPDWVRNFALKQEFAVDPINQWPGKRTKDIAELNPALFGHIINKFFSVFYDHEETQVRWKASAYFHMIDESYETGWVHRDQGRLITGVVYLNEGDGSGTSVYEPISPGLQLTNAAILNVSLKDPEENTPLLKKYRDDSNSQFKESIVVKNKFNRLIAFDSHLHHAANNFFGTDTSSRLTLVFFISKLDVNAFPLQRVRRTI
jgi:hypothetical protein